MLAPSGHLVYSTCTFTPSENENIIEDFLQSHPHFDSVCINHKYYGLSPANQGLTTNNSHAARIWPHRHRGEGHFIALLRRRSELHSPAIKQQPNPKFNNKDFNEFCDKYLTSLPSNNILEHRGNLLALPKYCPDVTGLNIVRLGVLLGSLKKNRFEPSYALAMSLTPTDFSQVIDLQSQDPHIIAYLEGQTLEIDAPDGHNLFCVDGYPLGFAKILKGRLKGRINGR